MDRQAQLEKAEFIISHILRWGVITCALVIASGWVLANHHMIMVGLLMLICLPISRVFAAGIIFLFQKDFIYVGLSFYVLLVLLASLFLGKQL